MASFSEHSVSYGSDKSKHIFYLACGPLEGPLLIFCHGWPGIGKTWIHQLNTFASLGFRCIAPDMPGYGKSTVTDKISDYSQENIVEGMLALLADTDRDAAVWIGHDWGSGCVWSFAVHHPQKCIAAISLAVPYRLIELGVDECVKYSDRSLYPKDKYPDAQWSYMRFYVESFDKAVAFHNSDAAGFTKKVFTIVGAHGYSQPALTATTVQDGGWFGGAKSAPPPEDTPDDAICLPNDVLADMTEAFKKNGYFAPDAYYNNIDANRAYNLAPDVDPVLRMPVLFIGAQFDTVCHTLNSRLTEPQRRLCRNLSQVHIDAGHFVQLEKPAETNAVIARWLSTEVSHEWPGAWRGEMKLKL
ncbi:hypothetical protein HIM_00637 [Hirsutella minnesotensis 3608]|nr:hypothetical protein HIM_00637 [Hirsutella minnesotensis 3608]